MTALVKHRHLLRVGDARSKMATLAFAVIVLLSFDPPVVYAYFNCPTPQPGTNMNVTYLTPYLVAVTCISPVALISVHTHGFTDGTFVKTSRCIEEAWTTLNGAMCENKDYKQCMDTPPEVEGATSGDPQLMGHTAEEPREVALAYKCTEGSFLSGEPARLTSCTSNGYTQIHDYCSEGCSWPKDCSMVMNPTNSSGPFKLSPTNFPEYIIMAKCQNFSTDGTWTLVSRLLKSNSGNYDESQVKMGHGEALSGRMDYFMGMAHLAGMAQTSDHQDRPLMLLITIKDEMGKVHHATYEGVTINPDTYEFTVSGNFYGNAPNCWKDLTTFAIYPAENREKCNVLTSPISWAPLKGVAELSIYVRPQEYDQKVACPPLPLRGFMLMNRMPFFEMPIDRQVGSAIRYACFPMFYEPNTMTSEGNVTCVMGEDGTLAWDADLSLPCVLVCPEPFFKSFHETHCLYLTEEAEPFGVHSAALSCREYNSSLVSLTDPFELLNVMEGKHYYTGHYDGVNSTMQVDQSMGFNCSDMDTCQATKTEKCMTVTHGLYKMNQCNDTEAMAMCRLPVICPNGYIGYRGLCYNKVCESEPANLTAHLAKCAVNGSGLAYPESEDVLWFFADWGMMSGMATGDIALGINDVDGDVTNGGLYDPDAGVMDLFGESTDGKHWRKLNVGENGTISLLELDVGARDTTCFVCQYLTSTECTTEPLAATVNMSRVWDGNLQLNATANYSCYPGYFVNGNITVTTMNATCIGQLGNWHSDPKVFDCHAVDVCLTLPMLPLPDMIVEETATSRQLNGTVNFICPENTVMEDGTTIQSTTCVEMNMMYTFNLTTLQMCHKHCGIAPTVVNATTDWDEMTIYINNTNVTAACNPGHQYAVGMNKTTLLCLGEDMWETVSCYPACEDDPPVPGENMNQTTPLDMNSVGTVLNYTCTDGFYTAVNETFPEPKNQSTVECNSDGVWVAKGPLTCLEMCLDDPPAGEDPFTSTWDGLSRVTDTQVEIKCDGMLLGDLNETRSIKCVGGAWTKTAPNVTTCVVGTYHPPNETAPESIGATLEGLDPPYLEGAQINYTCQEEKLAPMGVEFYTVSYTPDGWTEVDPEFICYDVSYDDPVPNVTVGMEGILGMPPTPYYVGIIANYTCPGDTVSPTLGNSIEITYTPDGWEPIPPEFVCLNVTYLPPAIPAEAFVGGAIFMVQAPYHVGQEVPYTCVPGFVSSKRDADGNVVNVTYITYLGYDEWSELDPEFVCEEDPNAPPPPTTTETPLEMFDKNVFDEAYEITSDNHMPSIENFMGTVNGPEYVLTDGPFGFGYAIRLNTPEQCMKRSPYATPDDCTSDPKTCTKGFTIGIWERVNISFNVFYTVHKYPEDRKRYIFSTGGDEFGHPGIALYHQGLAIIGLVSTGDEYWQVDVLGNFDVNEWYHIALRFIASVGLEMFKDGKKVGHCHMSKNSAPRLALLNPSELLVGCHRDADNTNYRDYNNADFDEFATWNRRLPDSELSYLRGGNEEKVENLSPEECAHMLSKTDLKDSKQADIAMNMLNAMADTIPVVEESDNTTDTVKYNGTVKPLDAAGLKLKGIADVIHEVTKPKVIRDTYTVEDLDTYFKVVETASKILDESYAEQWHAIEESGHRGARGVKEDMERYVDIIASRIPLDKKNPQPMSYIKTTDNIMVKIEKMSIKDFREIGGTYATPDYREDGMEDLYREWDLPFDKVKVPTDLFSDPRCQMHPVSIVTCFYDSYDDVQSSEVISDQITPEGGLELGSRVLRVNISIDKPLHRKGHPKYYECHFDPKKVDKARIRFNLENKLKMPQLRALSFHHNELQTPVKQRLCIWWNTVINGWDTAGCKVLDTTSLNTKCVCRHWGTVATLVEFVEEKYPPYESDTAKYVKLFLYIISDICLLIYILVVFLAGDLKDQFHISGAALSVSVIGGSTALLISDSENIQSDRHNCAAMGTLIQGFYLMSGGWVAMLGHAGFKAVSKGIITGRLKSYCLISSGIALAVVGVSYAFYIHDMGTDPRCFIAWDDNLKLILFFCPLMCFLCVGVFFACVIFFNIRHAKKLNKAIETDLSSFILGSTYVMIYYFIVWVVGILSYIHFDGEYLGCYPTFQILNSLVGVVILLSLGIHSLKFRRVLTAASKRRGEMLQKMKETANKAKPKALNKPKGNNAKAPPAKAPPPSKPSTNPPPTQPPANPPPPQAPPKPPTPAPPAKPPTPQPPADLCPPAENPSQQAADLLDL